MEFIDLKRGDEVSSLAVSEKKPETLTVLGVLSHATDIAPRNKAAALQLIEWLHAWIDRLEAREASSLESARREMLERRAMGEIA